MSQKTTTACDGLNCRKQNINPMQAGWLRVEIRGGLGGLDIPVTYDFCTNNCFANLIQRWNVEDDSKNSD